VPKSYRADARRLLRDPVVDGVLEFSRTPAPVDRVGLRRGRVEVGASEGFSMID